MSEYRSDPAWAAAADAADPLRHCRDAFLIPPHGASDSHYFCGHSLGLQPRQTAAELQQELQDWASLGVEGHFKGRRPWLDYHRRLTRPLAGLVGARDDEVVAMNSLSVNLHLLMVSFYRPTAERPAILIEAGAFPSDRYAVESQIRFHGLDPAKALIELHPDQADGSFSDQAICEAFAEHGPKLALALLPAVQYRTGQAFPLADISRWAHAQGCLVGFDLAHAVGNLDLQLHASEVDFAVWCSYKYLNAGPGSIGGAFVHQRHAQTDRPRFAGWWGQQQATRFQMGDRFEATPGAEGWQLSNPPIFAMAPLLASLELFQAVGMTALREKSIRLTGYLEWLIDTELADVVQVLTPRDPRRRGAQLSLRVLGGRDQGRALFEHLSDGGIIGDWREPDVIRLSPVPLYNRYADCRAAVDAMAQWRAMRR
ncbi:kynureninase [Frateuria aurantia]|uniref:Kynureninase n=1 Tax=Frateuria aurantia (strain ATCC 33424 / DSM 6220 / KCTC 2777 / LMG 1558 / NBRC 3245 / NCIMB 13370) TaxID=767434 RepID=H8L2R5_FRAAD|nr:kynureninase [Frateuria aurantia]AFC86424.1 kynureninase [Frateuria aurantia DSM 6220]